MTVEANVISEVEKGIEREGENENWCLEKDLQDSPQEAETSFEHDGMNLLKKTQEMSEDTKRETHDKAKKAL